VHNRIYSQSARPGDPAWTGRTAATGRNLQRSRAGLAAARQPCASYLIQSYARDIGNGNTVE